MSEKWLPSEQNFSPEVSKRILSRDEFQGLAEIPWEREWFANLKNEHTKLAYRRDIADFIEFVWLGSIQELQHIVL